MIKTIFLYIILSNLYLQNVPAILLVPSRFLVTHLVDVGGIMMVAYVNVKKMLMAESVIPVNQVTGI